MGLGVSLLPIMEAMADRIREVCVAGAPDVDVQVEPRMVLNPTPPTVDIYPGDPQRDTETAAFRDVAGAYVFTVRARVQTADSYAGQDLLLGFLDDGNPLSLTVALNGDRKLGGLANSLDVDTVTGYLMFPAPNNEGALLGAQWTVRVMPVLVPALSVA